LRAFVDAMSEMRQQAAPRLSVELAVVRVTMPEADDSAASAIARIERLERLLEVKQSSPTEQPATAKAQGAPAPAKAEPKAAVSEEPPAKSVKKSKTSATPAAKEEQRDEPSTAAGLVDLDMVRRSWPVVLEEIRKESRKLHALLGDAGVQSFDGRVITVEVRFAIHGDMVSEPKNSAVIANAVHSVFGISPVVRAVVSARAEEPAETMDTIDDTSADPLDVLKSGFGDDLVEE
jgi:DNA polymerase-3 subunit gamma/tau